MGEEWAFQEHVFKADTWATTQKAESNSRPAEATKQVLRPVYASQRNPVFIQSVNQLIN